MSTRNSATGETMPAVTPECVHREWKEHDVSGVPPAAAEADCMSAIEFQRSQIVEERTDPTAFAEHATRRQRAFAGSSSWWVFRTSGNRYDPVDLDLAILERLREDSRTELSGKKRKPRSAPVHRIRRGKRRPRMPTLPFAERRALITLGHGSTGSSLAP